MVTPLVSCICLLTQVHLFFITTSTGLVVNGTLANILDFPHQALITTMSAYKVEGSPARIVTLACGVLLNSYWVVTAAHVMLDKEKYTGGRPVFKIRLGVDDVTQTGEVADVELYRCHPSYSPLDERQLNDICIVKTLEMIRLSDRVKPVAFPEESQDDSYDGFTEIKFSGFGLTLDPEDKFEHFRLREADVRILSPSSCGPYVEWNRSWPLICGNALVEHSVRVMNPLGASAEGDSGSGLVARTSTGKLVLLGILSHGLYYFDEDGRQYKRASIDRYTKVSHFVEWILEHMC